jgi:hypothetical protein
MELNATKPSKISVDEFKELVRMLPEVREGIADFPTLARRISVEKLTKMFDAESVWSELYELPFEEFLVIFIFSIGKLNDLFEAVKSPDPSRSFLNKASKWDLEGDLVLPEGIEEKHIFLLTYALQRQILSIMLYHRPLSRLVAEAASGDLNSLFLAVRVDRSVVACPPIAVRIAKAEFLNDKRFFLHLRAALKGPSGKHWEAYRDLRYAFALLREVGFDFLSDAQLESLLVDQLGLYPKVPGARKNLRKQMTEAKKIATTSK